METVRKKIADLRTQIDEKDDIIQELKEELGRGKQETEELERENKSLSYQLNLAKDDFETTEEKLRVATEEKKTFENSSTDIANYSKAQVESLERELDRTQCDLDKYKSMAKEYEVQVEALTRENASLDNQLNKITNDYDSLEAERDDLKKELDELMSQLAEV